MSLEVDATLARGDFILQADFAAGPGLTALFGRSGSGKSTIIDLIAGLLRPDRGRIVVDGDVLLDTSARIALPAHKRAIGTVFQEARLLPHLNVRQNLLFGRYFARRRPAGAIDFDGIVALLDIEGLLDRRPSGLSGGERQRVAIGRALLARPRLLLMDEPLSALDEARKQEILPYIERLRDEVGLPIVYVSHSVSEVARLASTVVVMEAGRVVATGPAETVLRRPDLLPTLGEAGAILDMAVEDHETTGLTRLTGQAGSLQVPRLDLPKGAAVRVRVRARDVILATHEPRGLSARNLLSGRIAALNEAGDTVNAEIDCRGAMLAASLTRASVSDLGLAIGSPIHAIIKSVTFDPGGVGTRSAATVEI